MILLFFASNNSFDFNVNVDDHWFCINIYRYWWYWFKYKDSYKLNADTNSLEIKQQKQQKQMRKLNG